jgi:hypothetical protein
MPAAAVVKERWILTVKELHLGYCKETFRAGAVIELDEENGRLVIDGRRFNDTRDLDVLKRQAVRTPDNPWIIPYSKEAREEIFQLVAPPARPGLKEHQKLQVIKSDSDLNEPIDISSTKVSQVNAAKKAEAKEKVRTNGMEIIRGDETVEERLASLKSKTDIGSIAERARLKASGAVRMNVVRDDSLGAGFGGRNNVSMNAGQHLPSREEADAKRPDAVAQAAARKKESELRRKNAEGSEDVSAESTSEPAATDLAAENANLRAENSSMAARLDRMEKMIVAQQGAAPRRGRKPKAAAQE